MEGVKFEKPTEYILKEGFRAKRFESKEGSQDKYIEKGISFLLVFYYIGCFQIYFKTILRSKNLRFTKL